MDRRNFVYAAGTSALLFGAGCSSGGDDIEDTDGDGVIDSEDYAPRDPDVQEEADIRRTPTVTPVPTGTGTPTATATPTATPAPEAGQLIVDDSYWQALSHVTAYGRDAVTARITDGYPETEYDTAKLFVSLSRFPREEVVAQALSDRFDRSDGPHDITVAVDPDAVTEATTYNYFVGLVTGETTLDDVDYSNVTTIMETDPFVSTNGTIERDPYEHHLDDDDGETYSRNSVEGAYHLEVSGRTFGNDWTIEFLAQKSAHAAARNRDRGRSRSEYVSYELTDGTAEELASLLREETNARDYSKDEAVELVIDFVQALPYVPDDVSRDFDDYTKFIMETMPEMGGDCEDTAIMLASVLEADPFGYDMVLIQPPGHMAAGIWQQDPDGWYWELNGRKYSYIEATGRGWGVGDCPEEYQNQRARLHQV